MGVKWKMSLVNILLLLDFFPNLNKLEASMISYCASSVSSTILVRVRWVYPSNSCPAPKRFKDSPLPQSLFEISETSNLPTIEYLITLRHQQHHFLRKTLPSAQLIKNQIESEMKSFKFWHYYKGQETVTRFRKILWTAVTWPADLSLCHGISKLSGTFGGEGSLRYKRRIRSKTQGWSCCSLWAFAYSV